MSPHDLDSPDPPATPRDAVLLVSMLCVLLLILQFTSLTKLWVIVTGFRGSLAEYVGLGALRWARASHPLCPTSGARIASGSGLGELSLSRRPRLAHQKEGRGFGPVALTDYTGKPLSS